MAADYIGKEKQITIGGKTYTLSRITRSILKQFAAWVAEHTVNPLELAAKYASQFSPELQKILLAQAFSQATRQLDIEGPEVREARETFEGQLKMVQLLLAEKQPELTEDEIFDLSQQYFQELVDAKVAEDKANYPLVSEDTIQEYARKEVMNSNSFRV